MQQVATACVRVHRYLNGLDGRVAARLTQKPLATETGSPLLRAEKEVIAAANRATIIIKEWL